jgi:hypothetical protein
MPPELDPGPPPTAARHAVLVEDVDYDDDGEGLDVVHPQSGIPAAMRTSVDSMMARMDTLFPSDIVGARRLLARARLERAFTRANQDHGIAGAVAEAGGFTFDPVALQRDLADFRTSGDNLEAMIRERRRKTAATRLNMSRVAASICTNNPEYAKLQALAQHGVEVSRVLPKSFKPTGGNPRNWPPQRPTYVKASTAVNRLLSDFHNPGIAIILPTAEIHRLQNRDACNIFTSSWAPKGDSVKGRPTADPTTMNGEETKANASALWGKVSHPTIDHIVHMINGFIAYWLQRGKTGRDMKLWKVDVKSAYTRLDYALDDCKLFMTELSGGLVFIYTCGCFGFTGQPMAFDVVTRALRWELDTLLRGKGDAYTDDFFGICLTGDLQHDMEAIQGSITQLLGEDAISAKKCLSGDRLELIGWIIDLRTMLLTIGERCLERALYGYVTANEFKPTALLTERCCRSRPRWTTRRGVGRTRSPNGCCLLQRSELCR